MRIALIALLLAGCGGTASTARVERVVDGDTIVVRIDGRSERVRYIGVDTPESVKPGVPVQCFAKAAAAANRRLVLGRTVRLEYDAEARDRYGRLLAYVWRGDVLVNAELVRLGYGKPLEIAPNLVHAAELRRLASTARRSRLGLWSRC
ncbi:thermonuclease family protein [Solirubrobacter soli]|uniref:thermonuclease family protein n=1 Tax=Solirubrobacter soli TaxID=363832 RepID=UPI0003F96797|nr:thermonuclease family protein [Solirubrobacter soli]